MNHRLALAVVALVLALAGCAAAPPVTFTPSSAPASPPLSAPVTASASGSPTASPTSAPSPTSTPTPVPPFQLTSGAFAGGATIPRAYTCDGADTSPDLAWTGAPTGTTALVLVVDDPDAGGFAHWLVLDMAPDRSSLARGAGTPASSALRQGTNDFGRVGWGGPCPPSGEHRYRFTLYALAAPLGLDGSPRAAPVRSALAGATVLGRAVLLGRYRRGG